MDWETGTEVIAQYNYAGNSTEDLPFKKDELLRVISKTKDPNWVRVENREGCEGLVPSAYIRRKPRLLLERMGFFHGDVSRADTERLLRGEEDGRYLVRHSANYPGDFTLSIAYRRGVEHYRIQRKENGNLTCDDEEFFPTLPELIQHYEEDADGLCCRLRAAVPAKSTRPLSPPSPASAASRPASTSPRPPPPFRPSSAEDAPDSAAATPNGRLFVDSAWTIRRADLVLGDAIGRGEFADVHVGLYQGRKVAVKALKATSNSNLAQSLITEAAVMTSLRHKNLVQLLGVVMDNACDICLVTEFMPNGNLVDYLRSRGRQLVTAAQQISFACDACEGMAYLESKGICHRDLAARNILLAEDMAAKVSDFGLAKSATISSPADDANGKFPIKWTAPEALRFSKFTSKSDVWSFGVLLWEIYSFGRVPYPRIPIQDVVRHIEKGYRMEPPDACPSDINSLMAQAWALNPSQRPTFRQMLVNLRAFEASQ